MNVRLLTAADAAAYRAVRIAALEERPPAFGALVQDEPDLIATAARLTATRDRCFFGAIEGDQLVGILRLSRYSGSNEKHRFYLAGFYVKPEFRRRGYGRALVRTGLERAMADPTVRRINLSVVAEQTAAIRLYESFGFTVCGLEREAFECDGKFYDEQIMTLDVATAGRSNVTP